MVQVISKKLQERGLHLFLGIAFSIPFLHSQAQIVYSMYYSTQTGQSSMFRGAAEKTTGKTESGLANVKITGPLMVTVNPELRLNTSETKKFEGKILVDGSKAPMAGKSEDAQIIGDYSITYSRPQGRGVLSPDETVTGTYDYGDGSENEEKRGIHEIVKRKGIVTIPLKVYSIDCKFTTIPSEVCQNRPFKVVAEEFPKGKGKIVWGDGYEGGQRTLSITKDSTLTLTYEVEGVAYKISQKVKIGNSSPWQLSKNTITDPSNFEVESIIKEMILRLPGSESFVIEGPFVSKKVYTRNCCSADTNKATSNEEKVSGNVSYNIRANQISLQERPYKGSFRRRINRFGYTFEIVGQYETEFNFNGSIEAGYNHYINSCANSKSCNSEIANLNIPVKMTVKTSGKLSFLSYSKKGERKSVPFTAPNTDVFPMIRGKIGFNQNSCSDGLKYRVGLSETVANIKASVGAYEVNFPLTITPGFDLIKNY